MSKGPRHHQKEGKEVAPVAFDDDFANLPLAAILSKEPAARDEVSLLEALEWWLESLPASGQELAPELQAPGGSLLEAFRRGKLLFAQPRQRVHEEGEEIRFYTIVLMGSLRLRCHAPAPKSSNPTVTRRNLATNAEEAEKEAASVTCEVIGKGESPGLIPGEELRARVSAVCTERSVLLQLSTEDYAATLKPHHQQLVSQALEFLQTYNVCHAASSTMLVRLAASFRIRNYRRGALLMRTGECQRQIWILRSGSCTVMESWEVGVDIPSEGDGVTSAQAEELAKEDENAARLKQMRAAKSTGPVDQLVAAGKDTASLFVSQYGCGNIRSKLTGSASSQKILGAAAAARLTEPGTLVGKEVLLYEGFREQIGAKCVSTVRIDCESSLYSLDLSCFKLLSNCVGADGLADQVHDQVERRTEQLGRARAAGKKMERERRQLQKTELLKAERQEVHLPKCTSMPSAALLDEVDDWLQVTLEHRRAPPNDRDPHSLACLETLGLNPKQICGPGIEALLKAYHDQVSLKQDRDMLRWRRRAAPRRENPMGDTVPVNARYDEAVPRETTPELSLTAPPSLGTGMSGIFFQTELDFDDASASKVSRDLSRSSSVPVFPKLRKTDEERGLSLSVNLKASRMTLGSTAVPSKSLLTEVPNNTTSLTASVGQHKLQLVRSFHKAVQGKTIVVLTDKADVRKAIVNALLSTASELSILMARNSSELLARLRDGKEQLHSLILDLSKSDLQAESIVTAVRNDSRYSRLPIIVLAPDAALPEIVRNQCSFVVFHPISATMLREALLWCFDRRSLQGHVQYEVPISRPQSKEGARAAEVLSLAITATAIEVK